MALQLCLSEVLFGGSNRMGVAALLGLLQLPFGILNLFFRFLVLLDSVGVCCLSRLRGECATESEMVKLTFIVSALTCGLENAHISTVIRVQLLLVRLLGMFAGSDGDKGGVRICDRERPEGVRWTK